MSVTESDQNGQATMTVSFGDGGTAPGFQHARTRARHEPTPESANQPVTERDAPWSVRAGKGIRSGASATISHPRTWGIWDQHPASTRAVIRRAAEYAPYGSPNVLVRWPARAVAGLITAWSAFFSLLAVAPRNKTCWALFTVALIAWLTWRH